VRRGPAVVARRPAHGAPLLILAVPPRARTVTIAWPRLARADPTTPTHAPPNKACSRPAEAGRSFVDCVCRPSAPSRATFRRTADAGRWAHHHGRLLIRHRPVLVLQFRQDHYQERDA
jgi:hypothetical protein